MDLVYDTRPSSSNIGDIDAEKSVVSQPNLARRPGKQGYDDWAILIIQGLKEHLRPYYRYRISVRSKQLTQPVWTVSKSAISMRSG